ncbi:MAG: hydrogenase formation protein HypD [Phycisphaerae bacterium]|nr:hydrogenase formation protein HypD [Phycisphaerae bacterium]
MLQRILKAQQSMDSACNALGRQINIMEVCGTHTVSIFRNGIRPTLSKKLKLLSGPGCPVCVTDQAYIDTCIELSQNPDCIITTYGDMIRVPGKGGSLETQQSSRNIKVVLSAEDALDFAKQNPEKTIVFVAVGFETTTPATAVVIKEAAEQNIKNFTVLCNHKRVVPAMKTLLAEKNHKIDAFLCPGHVSVIIGSDAYKPIVDEFKRPCVVGGFEPMQIIESLAEICRQLEEQNPQVKSLYSAAVTSQGNLKAQKLIDEIFTPCDGYWRGLGKITTGTLKIKDQYSDFDTAVRFGIEEKSNEDVTGCRCGEVLCGLIDPQDCGLFATGCTPQSPVGPCMVSSEGACSAWYKYGRKRAAR